MRSLYKEGKRRKIQWPGPGTVLCIVPLHFWKTKGEGRQRERERDALNRPFKKADACLSLHSTVFFQHNCLLWVDILLSLQLILTSERGRIQKWHLTHSFSFFSSLLYSTFHLYTALTFFTFHSTYWWASRDCPLRSHLLCKLLSCAGGGV